MRVLVCGSRKAWKNSQAKSDLFAELDELDEYASQFNERVFVLHGDCKDSPDQWGGEWQRDRYGDEAETYPANWTENGWQAGFIRNEKMAATKPLFCVAVWDGYTNGTKDMIERATRHGSYVRIVPTNRA